MQSGDQFIAGRSGGVVGAVVPCEVLLPASPLRYIFHAAGTHDLRAGACPALCPTYQTMPTWPSFRRWENRGGPLI
jgi:hypothetical protein